MSDIQCGKKSGYARTTDDGNNVVIAFDCEVYPDAIIEVTVTKAQYAALLDRSHGHRTGGPMKLIHEIVPKMDPALREIFVSGLTPAEWDMAMTGKAKAMRKYPGYRALPSE